MWLCTTILARGQSTRIMPQTGAPILLAVVVDDVVVLMGAQVGGQGADAVLLLSGTARISTP